jgi:hypothetical protein
MNDKEVLDLYREVASLRKQLAEAEGREQGMRDNIERAIDYLYLQSVGVIAQKDIDEIVCRLNGE